ncbi:amidase family protein [Oceanobacillus chungangensis]|uniref:Amidase n=1 Tax=Oceanobacillus chungangensis TaxID=1229152 RepID=A0A3D8PUI1_9BACI|nr:amidase family protein [Oceanobacillus chungangensis]RDW19776.1 amidase [Oceanobacillus chungangensis]
MKNLNPEPDWLLEITIDELQEKLTKLEITSEEVVRLYLYRIANYDKSGPSINSIIEINPEAIHIASALDYERKTKGSRGILHGIPILIKDNIDTADKMHTSSGSVVLADSYASSDAHIVGKLREAGAIILGKTNLTEWAHFTAENMPPGYSSRGGRTLNPYSAQFSVGGSSSGSGAAIAANFAVVSVGTETSGSILSPASQNGIVGIKPTLGLVSRSGIIPISHNQDTAGPMARTVRDAAILLNVLMSVDLNDPITCSNSISKTDFTTFLNNDGLQGKRIGVARKPFFTKLSKEKISVLDQAIVDVRQLGAEVIDPIEIPSSEKIEDINVMLHDFKIGINAYLKTIDPSLGIGSLKDVIAKNAAIGDTALKYGQSTLLLAEETSGTLTEPLYLQSLLNDTIYSREKGIDAVMKQHSLDAIVFPDYKGALLTAKAGYPSINVPAGFTAEGEPVGITFTAKAYQEPTLLEIAYSYEQGTKHRKPPVF